MNNIVMDFSFSEEQEAMRDSLQRMFGDMCDDDQIKKLSQSKALVHERLWQQLADAGIFALPFSEDAGGLGLSLVEFCMAVELQGRYLPQLPLISSVVESALAIEQGENAAIKDSVLPGVIDGSHILCSARRYTGLQPSEALSISCDENGVKTINGRTGFAAYAACADGILLELNGEDGALLLVYLNAQANGVTCIEQTAISGEPAGYFVFSQVEFSDKDIVAQGQRAEELVTAQRHATWVALAAQQTGILEEALRRAAEYVSERKQFGRALGSFQAVSQQAADAYMEVESLRSVYWRALDDIQSEKDIGVSAAVAKYWVAQAGHKVAHTALHLHGGIGQDLEYPIHRFFLWAKQAERVLGSVEGISSELGRMLLSSSDTELAELCS